MDLKLIAFNVAEEIFQINKPKEFVGYTIYSQIEHLPNKDKKLEFIHVFEEELVLYNPKNINMWRFRIKGNSSDPKKNYIERIDDKILFKSRIGGQLLYFKNTTRLFDVIAIIGSPNQNVGEILSEVRKIKNDSSSFEELREKIQEYQNEKLKSKTQIILRSDLFKRWGQEEIHIGEFRLNQKVAKNKTVCSFEISDQSWDDNNYTEYFKSATNHLEVIKKSLLNEKAILLSEYYNSKEGYNLNYIATKLSIDKIEGKTYFEFDKDKGFMHWKKLPAKKWQKYITAFLFYLDRKKYINILELNNSDLNAACKNQFNCGNIHNENLKQLKYWTKIKDIKSLNEEIRNNQYLSHYEDFFSKITK